MATWATRSAAWRRASWLAAVGSAVRGASWLVVVAELHVAADDVDADAGPVHLDALDFHAQRQRRDRHGQVLQLIGDLGRQPLAGQQVDVDLVAGFPGYLQRGRAADDEQ